MKPLAHAGARAVGALMHLLSRAWKKLAVLKDALERASGEGCPF